MKCRVALGRVGSDGLTKAENKVLWLLAIGFQNKEAADRYGRGIKTIEKHRAAIYRKLGVRDTVSMVRRALVKGLIQMQEWLGTDG